MTPPPTTVPMPRWPRLAAYASLRMPLAMLELPLFVLLPNFYSSTLGLDLVIVGSVLFMSRLIDAILDPAFGRLIDLNHHRWPYRQWIWLALPVLTLGFIGMLHPPVGADGLAAWLAITSIVTYAGYSICSIAYQAWGARLGQSDAHRARVTGVREGFGLLGVLVVSALLTPEQIPALSTLFVVFALGCALALRYAPSDAPAARPDNRPGGAPAIASSPGGFLFGSWALIRTDRAFKWLLAVLAINGIATAIPATLILFFIDDVLQLREQTPQFLVAYFLAGALGMPVWIWLAARVGLRNAWLMGMGFAVIAFIWALELPPGAANSFMIVCVMTGFALGADLAMPPALLASIVARQDSGEADRSARQAEYFGIWNFIIKFNLAAAAGLALPLLAWLGYVPGAAIEASSVALPMVYAALPCALKLLAAMLLFVAPIQEKDLTE